MNEEPAIKNIKVLCGAGPLRHKEFYPITLNT